MGECNDRSTEPSLAAQSSRYLHELRSTELDVIDNMQVAGNCHHFSIRGYVAEIRKSNRELCWPFHLTDSDYKLEEHANLLPPITIPKFRWWNCQDCLFKSRATGVKREHGAITNSQDGEVEKLNGISFHEEPVLGSHSDAQKLLSDFQGAPEKIMLGDEPVGVNSSAIVNGSHCCPSVCSDEKDREFAIADKKKEDSTRYGGRFNRPEEDQNLRTEAPTSSALNDEPFIRGGTDTGISTSMIIYVSEICHRGEQGHSKNNTVENKEKTDSEVEDHVILQGLDTCIQKDDVVTVTAARVNRYEHVSVVVDKSNPKEFTSNSDLMGNKDDSQHWPSGLGTPNGNSQRRKAPKVRTLNDIIKSEVLGLSGKAPLTNGGEVIPILDDCNTVPDAYREKKLHADCNSQVVEQEKVRMLSSDKKRNESPQVQDEGPSLMHWLKRMPKRVKSHKGDAEGKHVDSTVVNLKSVADMSTGKGIVPFMLKGHGATEVTDRKIRGGKKQNRTTQVDTLHHYIMPRQDLTPGNNLENFEVTADKQVNARKAVHPESVKAVHPESVRDKCSLQSDRPKKNAIWSKKLEEPPVAIGFSSSRHVLKDSFGTSQYETISGSQGSQKVLKKQSLRRKKKKVEHTGKDGIPVTGEHADVNGNLSKAEHATAGRIQTMGDRASVDGIPIEILELLQNNYHKRHILNSERPIDVADSSEVDKNMRYRKTMDFSNSSVNETPYSQLLLSFQSNNTGTGATGKSTGNSNHELGGSSCHDNGKRKRHVDMNHQEDCFASNGSPNPLLSMGQPRNGIQFPAHGVIGNYCPQNHSWRRFILQNIESSPESRAISGQNPCRYAPHGALGINDSQKIHSDIYHAKMLSQHMWEERNLNKVNYETIGTKYTSTTVTPHDKKKRKVYTKTNKRALSMEGACLEAGKKCHSRMIQPLNPCRNDTISAMHLLRLMDPKVHSTTPSCTPLDKDQTGFPHQTKHYYHPQHKEFLELGAGVRTNEASKYLGTEEYPVQSYNPGNSHKLPSPVPRVVLFGSVLQEGTAPGSNNFRTPSAFEGRPSNEVQSLMKIHGNEKTINSHSTTQIKVSKQSSVSRDRNSRAGTHSEPSKASRYGMKYKDKVGFPQKGSSQTELCVINRNPADFTIPDENNIYMIGYEDLKPRDWSPLRNREFSNYSDAQRQQAIMKLTAIKRLLRS